MTGAHPRDGDRPLRPLGCRSGERRRLFVAEWTDLHHRRPVRPVAVFDQQEDWRAEGETVADTAADARMVLLDLLASPAAVATLSALQVLGEPSFGQRNAGRHPLDDHAELWTV